MPAKKKARRKSNVYFTINSLLAGIFAACIWSFVGYFIAIMVSQPITLLLLFFGIAHLAFYLESLYLVHLCLTLVLFTQMPKTYRTFALSFLTASIVIASLAAIFVVWMISNAPEFS